MSHLQNPGRAEDGYSEVDHVRARQLALSPRRIANANTEVSEEYHRDIDIEKQRLEQEQEHGCVDQVTRLLDRQNGLAPPAPLAMSGLADTSNQQVVPTGGMAPSPLLDSTLIQSPRAPSQAGENSQSVHPLAFNLVDTVRAQLPLPRPPSKRLKDKPSVLPRFALSQDNATSSALLEVVTPPNIPVIVDEQRSTSSAAQDLPTDDAVNVSPLSSVPLEDPQLASEFADLYAFKPSMSQVASRLTEMESFPALAPSELEDLQSDDNGFQFVVFKPGQPGVLPVVKQESSPVRPPGDRVAPPNHRATGAVKVSAPSQFDTTFMVSCTQAELSKWTEMEDEDLDEPPPSSVDVISALSNAQSLENRIRHFVREHIVDIQSPSRQRVISHSSKLRPSASAATQRKARDASTSTANDAVRPPGEPAVPTSSATAPSVLAVNTTTKTSNKRKYSVTDANTSDPQPKKRQKVKILPKPLDPATQAQVLALRRKIELELVILNISLADAIDLW